MKNLTYGECRDFIKGITQVTVYENQNATNLSKLISKYGLESKVLVITGDNKHAILFPFGSKYWVIYFYKNKFYKEKHVSSPLRYESKNYNVTCHQVSLNEMIIWLDSHRFMEQQVNLSREDSEILSRHNINIEKKKTTRKFLYDAYAKTITGDDKNIPDVKKVVDKYSKPIEPLLMVFEEENKKDDIEISEHDSAIFTRYGFNIDRGKTKYKTLCEQVKRNTINGKLGMTISPEDLAVFRRYGITFAPSGEAKGKIRLPLTRSALLKRFSVIIITLVIIGGTTWHFYGPAIRHYLGKQKNKIQANLEVAHVKQELRDIEEYTQEADKLYQLIVDKYPATLGYIDPHPRIQPLIVKSKSFVSQFKKTIVKSNELLQKGQHEQALKVLQPHNDQHDEHYQIKLDIIRRIVSSLKTTRYINRALKNEWLQEDNITTVLRKLRNYAFSAQELIDTIEEEQLLIDTKYEDFKDKIPLDINIATKMRIYKKQVDNLEETIRKAEKSIVEENDHKIAERILSGNEKSSQTIEEIIAPYSKFQSDIIKGLTNIYEDIDQKIQGLEVLRQKKSDKGEVLQIIVQKSQQYDDLKKITPSVENLLQEIKNIPTNLGIQQPPTQIAASIDLAKNHTKYLRDLIATANEHLDNNNTADAKEKLENSNNKYEEIMKDLNAASDIMREIRQTAKALQVENSKRAKQYSKRIVYIQKQQNTLQTMLTNFSKQIDNFDKVLPSNHAFITELKQYREKYSSFKKLNTQVQKKIELAQNNFQNKKIADALKLVSTNTSLTTKVKTSIGEITQSLSEIKQFIAVIDQQKQQFQLAKRVIHIENKIQKYTTKLKSILLPLEKKAVRLKKEFPTSQGHKDIDISSKQTLIVAKRVYSFYSKKLRESKRLSNQKMYREALTVLEKYEGKRLSPANFAQDLKDLQTDLNNQLSQAKLQKQSEGRTNTAQILIVELEKRRAGLRKTIPTLQNDLITLRNIYPEVLKETVGFSGAEKYVDFGKQEIEEINELLQEAQILMMEKKFAAVVTMLKPYSQKESPGLSVLSTLQTLEKNSRNIINKMQNPQQKQQMEKKLLAQQQKANRLKQLQRSPGNWYDDIGQIFVQYESLASQIVSSLKGRGSRIIHSTIEKRMRTIKEYPEQIAEIDYSLEFIKSRGKNINKEVSLSKKKQLAKYLQNKIINVNVDSEIFQLQSAVSNLRNELRLGGWVEENTLREYLRALDAIKRAFENEHRVIASPIISLEAQIPH
ncbi:hypothetical protein [Candidatus Uabimicrobium sp. HlEnr_7]|uniref:coiled-coil domain-containing protein n=1 Tax=Candidatus Uabimicrobium helgolandensis TaxID=3095367 RepID=UPI00355686C1